MKQAQASLIEYFNNFSPTKVNIIMLVVLMIFIVAIVILGYLVRSYIANAKKRNDILNAIYDTEERERNRIAKDLHDNLGALLSAVKLQASSIKQINNIQEIYDISTDLSGLVDSTISELRTIIKNILPANIAKSGWVAEIEQMKVKLERTRTMQILINNQSNTRYRPDVEMNLYRIMQELINNVIKHAEATRIQIGIIENKENLYIRFEDNGKGFKKEEVIQGIGMQSIESRANLYNGKLTFTSEPRLGTIYDLVFSLRDLK